MGILDIYDAAVALGYTDISVEPDGTVWLGADDARTYLTDAQQKAVVTKATQLQADKATAKAALLDRLGITADEAALLLG
jgi:hypothetical protein